MMNMIDDDNDDLCDVTNHHNDNKCWMYTYMIDKKKLYAYTLKIYSYR